MAGLGRDIEAGRAFVRLYMHDGQFVKGIKNSRRLLTEFAVTLEAVGRRLTLIATGMAVPIMFATNKFAEFDDRMRGVAARAELTSAEMREMADEAERLSVKLGFSAIKVAEAMEEFSKAGLKKDQLADATEASLLLSRATAENADRLAEIMVQTLTTFEKPASEAMSVADMLTVGANETIASVENLGETLEYVGSVAHTVFKASLAETIALAGGLAQVGIRGSEAGTALRRIFILSGTRTDVLHKAFGVDVVKRDMEELSRLGATPGALTGLLGVSSSKAPKDLKSLLTVLEEVNTAMTDMGSTEKAEKLRKIYGILGITGATAIGATAASIKELLDKLENSSGETLRQAEMMQSGVGGTLRILAVAFEKVQFAIGKAIDEGFSSFAQAASRLSLDLTTIISENKDFVIGLTKVIVATGVLGISLLGVGLALQLVQYSFGSVLAMMAIGGAILSTMLVPLTMLRRGFILLAANSVRSFVQIYRGLQKLQSSVAILSIQISRSLLSSLGGGMAAAVRVVQFGTASIRTAFSYMAVGVRTVSTNMMFAWKQFVMGLSGSATTYTTKIGYAFRALGRDIRQLGVELRTTFITPVTLAFRQFWLGLTGQARLFTTRAGYFFRRIGTIARTHLVLPLYNAIMTVKTAVASRWNAFLVGLLTNSTRFMQTHLYMWRNMGRAIRTRVLYIVQTVTSLYNTLSVAVSSRWNAFLVGLLTNTTRFMQSHLYKWRNMGRSIRTAVLNMTSSVTGLWNTMTIAVSSRYGAFLIGLTTNLTRFMTPHLYLWRNMGRSIRNVLLSLAPYAVPVYNALRTVFNGIYTVASVVFPRVARIAVVSFNVIKSLARVTGLVIAYSFRQAFRGIVAVSRAMVPRVAASFAAISAMARRTMIGGAMAGGRGLMTGASGALMGGSMLLSGMGGAIGTMAMALPMILSMGSSLAAMINPATMLTLALIGGAAAWLMFSESGKSALHELTNFFEPLYRTATRTIQGIAAAFEAGDIRGAISIAVLGMQTVFLEGMWQISEMVGGMWGNVIGSLASDLVGGEWVQAWGKVTTVMGISWRTTLLYIYEIFAKTIVGMENLWLSFAELFTSPLATDKRLAKLNALDSLEINFDLALEASARYRRLARVAGEKHRAALAAGNQEEADEFARSRDGLMRSAQESHDKAESIRKQIEEDTKPVFVLDEFIEDTFSPEAIKKLEDEISGLKGELNDLTGGGTAKEIEAAKAEATRYREEAEAIIAVSSGNSPEIERIKELFETGTMTDEKQRNIDTLKSTGYAADSDEAMRMSLGVGNAIRELQELATTHGVENLDPSGSMQGLVDALIEKLGRQNEANELVTKADQADARADSMTMGIDGALNHYGAKRLELETKVGEAEAKRDKIRADERYRKAKEEHPIDSWFDPIEKGGIEKGEGEGSGLPGEEALGKSKTETATFSALQAAFSAKPEERLVSEFKKLSTELTKVLREQQRTDAKLLDALNPKFT